ncbi:hypothetical protein HMF8227_02593 [Saliniradius amylolyticus]|uniref:Uncharacterized protein n=1 Tax=Saliniradius amylolyticus TaxID=2183582 RepID=A0A2S2E5V8_9ALTE|nr:hypothetical protein [Saliniradius amylolyticus]AWL13045.1 hypothetical protein HMF8227_02593 [Saliniradius amylolyticus]
MSRDGRYAESAGATRGDVRDGRYAESAGATRGDVRDEREAVGEARQLLASVRSQ